MNILYLFKLLTLQQALEAELEYIQRHWAIFYNLDAIPVKELLAHLTPTGERFFVMAPDDIMDNGIHVVHENRLCDDCYFDTICYGPFSSKAEADEVQEVLQVYRELVQPFNKINDLLNGRSTPRARSRRENNTGTARGPVHSGDRHNTEEHRETRPLRLLAAQATAG